MKNKLLFALLSIIFSHNTIAQRLIPVLEQGEQLSDAFEYGPNDEVIFTLSVEEGVWFAGYFDQCNDVVTPGLAFWDGSSFSLPGADTYPGDTFDAKQLVELNGFTYACGNASTGQPAVWFFDGSEWNPAAGGVFNDDVASIVVYNNSILVGGEFTEVDGIAADYIAYLENGNWVNFGDGIDDDVFALHVHENTLYAGGRFESFDGGELNAIARHNGTTWEQVGLGLENRVQCFHEFEGELLVGGRFEATTNDEVALERIAKIEGNTLVPLSEELPDNAGIGVLSMNTIENELYVSTGPILNSVFDSYVLIEGSGWERNLHTIVDAAEFNDEVYIGTNGSGDYLPFFTASNFFVFDPEGELFGACSNDEIIAAFTALPSPLTSNENLAQYFTQPFEDEVSTIYASALWYGGEIDGEPLVTANTFGYNTSVESVFGPYSGNYDMDYMAKYMRLWEITSEEIETHISSWDNPEYEMPEAILNWPGNGRVEEGEASHIAPFVDVNENGWYNPDQGDYPIIQGDHCITLLSSDSRALDADGRPGIEIVSQYFLYDTEGAVAKSMHVKHYGVNRSSNDYEAFKMGVWADFDIGNASDDYIGCSIEDNCFYSYNGDAVDEASFSSPGYGENIPAQALVFPNRDLWSFTYYNNGNNPINGEPSIPEDYINYLNGLWKTGQPMLFGGDGVNNPFEIDTEVLHMFPAHPQLTGLSNWNEISGENPPGDRRGLGTVPAFSLDSGESFCLDYIFVHDFNPGEELFGEVTQMLESVNASVANFNEMEIACDWEQFPLNAPEIEANNSLRIYPNPSTGVVLLNGLDNKSYAVSVFDITGKQVSQSTLGHGQKEMNLTELTNGIYLVRLDDGESTTTLKLVKQ